MESENIKQETETVADSEVTEVKKPSKKAKSSKKKSSYIKTPKKRTRKPKKKSYNVDLHPETGAMQLQELLFYKLMIAEQNIKICERDLQISKNLVKDFQTSANQQLQTLQSKVKEVSNSLASARTEYFNEVKYVEDVTGLLLKEWTIDDDRVLRPIEEPPKEGGKKE